MINPNRQQIIEAHDALKKLENAAWNGGEDWNSTHWKNLILAALPPKPKATMAETQWDIEEHYLAEAETESGIKVVMLSQNGDSIKCIQPPNAGDVVIRLPRKELTPTGRHYIPTQSQEG